MRGEPASPAMNIHTFKDAVTSKRQALANEVEEDEDDEDVGRFGEDLDGEEDDGEDKVRTTAYLQSCALV